MIADCQFAEFLDKLAADVKCRNGIILTEWESQFVGTYIGLPTNAFHFTEGRRKAVDRMWRRYGAELNWPHPLDAVHERPKMAKADPTGCEYLVRLDGVQQRCNGPATCQEPGKLRYCAMHGEAVERDMKRAGRRIALIKF
jgi:hypothetical protein